MADLFLLASLGRFSLDVNLAITLISRNDLGVQQKLETLFAE